MNKKVKSILLVILFVLCVGFMFAGCKKVEYVEKEVIKEVPIKEEKEIQNYNKFHTKDTEVLKIKTFYERPGYDDSYLTKYVNDWIDEHKKDIEIIDIRITGINGSMNPSSVVMIVYKEIVEESK